MRFFSAWHRPEARTSEAALRLGALPERILIGLGLFGGYLGLYWISFIYPWDKSSITPWNPQAAIVVYVLFRFGMGWLPIALAAVLAAELVIHRPSLSFATGSLIAATLTAGYGLIARLLHRPFAIQGKLETQRDLMRLLSAVALGSAVTGFGYVQTLASLQIIHQSVIPDAVFRFWIGDVVGMAVALPVLFAIGSIEQRAQLMRALLGWETAAQALVILITLWLVFSYGTSIEPDKHFYVLFLPLIWVAARDGLAGALWAMTLIQVGVIISVQIGNHPTLSVFELQALLIALVVTGLFLGVISDERERAAENLRHAQHLAAAGEIAGGLAHELHQPLAALTSYAKVVDLLSKKPGDQRVALQGVLAKIGTEVERAAQVVHRLRDFFRTGALHLELVELGALTREVLHKIEDSGAANGVEASFIDNSNRFELLLDRTQIAIVLRNLIANALEATRATAIAHKKVEIDITRGSDESVELTIRDTGTGLSTERAATLFEPIRSTKPAGMGLGLAISRSIAQAHGGSLWAEPGHQGVFRLRLPTSRVVQRRESIARTHRPRS